MPRPVARDPIGIVMDAPPRTQAAEFLSVPQVADRLGVSPTAVYVLLRTGQLTGYRPLARTWRVRATDLAAYMAARRSGPPDTPPAVPCA